MEARARLDLRIEVDGGIDTETAALCRAKGADTFVAGTSFFKAPDKAAFAGAFAARLSGARLLPSPGDRLGAVVVPSEPVVQVP